MKVKDKIVSLRPQENVLEACLRSEIEISMSCGGFGTCGTCLIHVQSAVSKLPQRNELEREMATERGFREHERLACQLIPTENLSFLIPERRLKSQ